MSSMPGLPSDILFEIAKRCGWKEVYALRRVSQTWFEVTKAKKIWVGLVNDIIAADPSSPPVHHLELSIDMYSSEDLEEIFERWMKMRHSWDLTANDLALRPPRAVSWIPTQDDTSTLYGLNRPYYIVPGGRWFIRFYDTGSATYQDLSNPMLEDSSPILLIEPLHPQPTRHITVFQPFMVTGTSTLTFLTGTCISVAPGEQAYHIHIYKVSLSPADGPFSEPELAVERLVTFRIVRDHLTFTAQDLQEDRLLLRLKDNRSDKQGAAVVFWREIQNGTSAAEMRFVPVPDQTYVFMNLLPYNRVLLNNGTSARMVDYTHAAVHHAVLPSDLLTNSPPGHLLASFPVSVRGNTLIHRMFDEWTIGYDVGRPYILRDESDRIVVRQVTIISDDQHVNSAVMGLAFAYHRSDSSTAAPLYSKSINFGRHQWDLMRNVAVLGYRHAILPAIIRPTASTTTKIHLALVLEWPQMSEMGDMLTEPGMDIRPVKPLVAYSRLPAIEWGMVRAMDEGTGRVFLLSGNENRGYRALASTLV